MELSSTADSKVPPNPPMNHIVPAAAPMVAGVPAPGVLSNAAMIAESKVPPVGAAGEEYEEIREQDRYLPIANIARIMKNTLPENAKIAKDSKETVQECVSEFISFITSEASDKCMQEKRKTINGDDLLWAMSTLGFDKYVEPLKLYLTKYREAVRGEKPEKQQRNNSNNVASGGNINPGNEAIPLTAPSEAPAAGKHEP
eukprot:CAMPEP_0195525208 /NCGR_PEP_ID=MMETSP0794_2-20130614/25522_1 /TAXON_ID=515487 /ORGANISM="Stephanopyxis turris, Strain CCMP 815" /LENGTH=199 /DNA_ID=CAMNT_0040655611 /DNA_START=252 /DNA_END=851 /DNA_ORIENTATION=+